MGNTCVILQCLSQGKRKNNFGIKLKNKFIEYFGNIIELYWVLLVCWGWGPLIAEKQSSKAGKLTMSERYLKLGNLIVHRSWMNAYIIRKKLNIIDALPLVIARSLFRYSNLCKQLLAVRCWWWYWWQVLQTSYHRKIKFRWWGSSFFKLR